MSSAARHLPADDDVLDAFSVEPHPDRETLERYLRKYPHLAAALVDLSRELSREASADVESLSASDQATIDAAWRGHAEAIQTVFADPFARFSSTEIRELARRLDVPRQVITALRERQVIVSSVPGRFMRLLADAVTSPIDQLISALSLPPAPVPGRSYKAERKPDADVQITFERLLVDAGVPEEKRVALMLDTD